MSAEPEQRSHSPEDAAGETVLQQIADALRGLKFGTITIIVQDGVVVQLERTEKRRLRRTDGK
ncbi:MAG: YezD family protein [Pirellulaceae bacterium]|nr:YezD family protein [Pirellulaceae bacterium]